MKNYNKFQVGDVIQVKFEFSELNRPYKSLTIVKEQTDGVSMVYYANISFEIVKLRLHAEHLDKHYDLITDIFRDSFELVTCVFRDIV